MGITVSSQPTIAITTDDESIPLSQYRKSLKVQLCSKNINQISSQIILLQHCINLQLCCNQISHLPLEIGYLSRLTILSLYNNQLHYIPKELYNLVQLVELDLSGNQLIGLSKSISKLQNLKVLNLDTNQIQELPQEIGNVSTLESLQLSNNPLRILPSEISRLKNLKTLALENCPLEPIPEVELFQENPKIPSLKELCARTILQTKILLKKEKELGQELIRYLDSACICSYCQGPFFDSYYSRGRVMSRIEGVEFPLEYKLCINHWRTNSERIKAMFAPPLHHDRQPIKKSLPRTYSFASLSSNHTHVGNLIRSFSTNSLKTRFLRRQTSTRNQIE